MKFFKALLLFYACFSTQILSVKAQNNPRSTSEASAQPVQSITLSNVFANAVWADKIDGVTIEALPCTKVTFGAGTAQSPFLKAEFDPNKNCYTPQQKQNGEYGIRFKVDPTKNVQLSHVEMENFTPKLAGQSATLLEKHTVDANTSYWTHETVNNEGRKFQFMKVQRNGTLARDMSIPRVFHAFANFPEGTELPPRYCSFSANELANIHKGFYGQLQQKCTSSNPQAPNLVSLTQSRTTTNTSSTQQRNTTGASVQGSSMTMTSLTEEDGETDSWINGKVDGKGNPPPLADSTGQRQQRAMSSPNRIPTTKVLWDFYYIYSPADRQGKKLYQTRRTIYTEIRFKGIPALILKTKPENCYDASGSTGNTETIPPCPEINQ